MIKGKCSATHHLKAKVSIAFQADWQFYRGRKDGTKKIIGRNKGVRGKLIQAFYGFIQERGECEIRINAMAPAAASSQSNV